MTAEPSDDEAVALLARRSVSLPEDQQDAMSWYLGLPQEDSLRACIDDMTGLVLDSTEKMIELLDYAPKIAVFRQVYWHILMEIEDQESACIEASNAARKVPLNKDL